jgi:hypothetical protein
MATPTNMQAAPTPTAAMVDLARPAASSSTLTSVTALPHPSRPRSGAALDIAWSPSAATGGIRTARRAGPIAEMTVTRYQALLPYADRPTGADGGIMTLGPAAQILGDLAGYLGLPCAGTHYQDALSVAARARVTLWGDAAMQRWRCCLVSGRGGGRSAAPRP